MKTCPQPQSASVREEERHLRRGLASSLMLQQTLLSLSTARACALWLMETLTIAWSDCVVHRLLQSRYGVSASGSRHSVFFLLLVVSPSP